MKVTFDYSSTNQNVDKATTTYRDTHTAKTSHAGGYALDISGTVKDNNAYGGQGKTAEEVMQDAGAVDIATQRDYMTVMSNCMSDEDFSRLQKEGYHPGDMEIEEVVTIVDKIKAEMVKGGTEVVGYTDSLDADKLREITGSEAFARELCMQFAEHDIPLTEENVVQAVKAYERASNLEMPEDGTVKYMVENQMEPTIDDLYRAGFSSTADSGKQGHGYYAEDNTGYYAKKAEEYNWEQLQPQMEKIIAQAGLSIDEENLEGAKWLIEAGVPLTPETMERLHEIRQLKLPQDTEQILSAIAAAISDGNSAGSANLVDGRNNYEKAADYARAFEEITPEAVDKTVADGDPVTLRNLEKAQEELSQDAGKKQDEAADNTVQYDYARQDTPQQVSARRQLEEVRLMMTIEANRKLLDSGFSIDTTELEKLVEALKEIEERQNQILWGETEPSIVSEKNELFKEACQKIAQIPYLPASVLGRYLTEEELFTLDSVHTNGTALKAAYEAARESYETLMTAPRADMGDSIRKAFRNVDDILKDMGLETSDENRRAVRILGYNSMDITSDNMDAVKKYDMELREALRKMSPAATLQAIRDGKNPLTMSMEELNEYLSSTDLEKSDKEEKFSKYLYKLEKNHAVSPEEREAYIGIYRMFRQLEKTDEAAVGALLKEGSELSFQALLTAMRSTKKQGMDYKVDDRFDGVDSVRLNKSITEQIMSGFSGYYNALAGEIADTMEPEMLAQMNLHPDMTMEEFAEELAKAETDSELEESYLQEQLQQYQELHDVEDAIIKELLDYKQPVTVDDLTAAMKLRKQGASLYRKLRSLDEKADRHNKTEDEAADFLTHFTDKEEAQEAYDKMQQSFYETIEEAEQDTGITYLDLKALQSAKKQLSLAGNLAKEENYQIPVEINGELTAINLKVLHGENGGKVSAVMQTESFGQVSAQFGVRNDTISGYIACDTRYGTEALQQKESALRENITEAIGADPKQTATVGSLGIVYSTEANTEGYTKEDLETDGQIPTAALYQIAKAFIKTVTS